MNCIDVSNGTADTCIVSDNILYGFGHINIDTYEETNCYTYDVVLKFHLRSVKSVNMH